MSKLNKISVPFTQVANSVLNDPNLSWKAKGIYAYLYSKPDGWDFSSTRMTHDSTDGRRGTLSGIAELEELGYITRTKQSNGRMLYNVNFKPKSPNGTQPKRHSAQKATISNKDSYKEIKTIQSNTTQATSVAVIDGKEIGVMIDGFKDINPLWKDMYRNTTERKALEYLAEQIGKEKLNNLIVALPELVAMPYAPKITKPTELRRDLAKLIVFIKQNSEITNKYQVTKIH